jgi:hypothetical protein
MARAGRTCEALEISLKGERSSKRSKEEDVLVRFTDNTMKEFAWVKTTRYSALFTRIFQHYRTDIVVTIDGKRFDEHDVTWLCSSWCTNARIRNTRDFTMQYRGASILGFHDHPENLWVALSEQSFLKTLSHDKIIRYGVCRNTGIHTPWLVRAVKNMLHKTQANRLARTQRTLAEADCAFREKQYVKAAQCYETVARSQPLSPLALRKLRYAKTHIDT